MGYWKKKIKKTTKWGRQAYIDKDGKKKMVHSRVAEKKYGYKKLPKGLVVHHIDGDKDNNRPNNLILMHRKDHYRIHIKKDLIVKEK